MRRNKLWAVLLGPLSILLLASLARAETPGLGFDAWVEELRHEALTRNISTSTLNSALSALEPLERVIELDRKQPESKLTFRQYLDRVLPDRRVEIGRRKLIQHRELLEEIRQRYGVQPRFVIALWGIESDFGRHSGNFPTIQALATLAFDGRRSAFFRGELLDALQIIEQGHVDAAKMHGSWAGAVGQPQFMPSSFRNFAVDHDGDSRRDIWGSIPDVLASVANYLASSGWRGDRAWGREVRLPDDFDQDLAGRKGKRPLAAWQALGVRRADGRNLPAVDVTAMVVQPDGPGGPAYLTYSNYDVLLKWNRSDYFATAVGLFADRLAR